MAQPAARTAPGNGAASATTSDWPVEAADAIERAVGAVRDKTTGPALTVARAVVYGTLAGIVGMAVAVLAAIAAVRALDAYLPDSVFGETHTWVAHLIVGALFSGFGLLLWTKRSRTDDEEHPSGV
jgi:hypothetical protein